MDRVSSYSMGRRTRSRDLEMVMEVGGSVANFSVVVEGIYRGVVGRDKKVGK